MLTWNSNKKNCFKADERWKYSSKNSQNVTLASTFCHIIPIDFVIILLVWKSQPSRTKIVSDQKEIRESKMPQGRSFVTLTLNPKKAKLLLK